MDVSHIIKEFINPYNFVPISKQASDKIDINKNESNELHTGYFECALENKTPLAIPDVALGTKDNNKHNYYPAFRINGRLAIPGSSLRGPIRSMYETLTNSCLVTMDPDEYITKRSDIGTFNACVLKYDHAKKMWKVYKANRIALVCGNDSEPKYKNIPDFTSFTVKFDKKTSEKYLLNGNEKIFFGDEVKIEKGKEYRKNFQVWKATVTKIEKANNTNCYLFLGEMFSRKHAESVFEIVDSNPLPISADKVKFAFDGLKETLKMYRSASINRNLGKDHLGYFGFERAEENGVIPLWYVEKNGNIYFSLASIGRMAYQTPMSVLASQHIPCQNRNSLCPACTIFGMVGKKKTDDGIGSSVRITDALLDNKTETVVTMTTLKELGTPRTSYLKFYSTGGKDYDDSGATIRGRKYYWHNPVAAYDRTVYEANDNEKTERNASIELISNKSVFRFKIYYSNMTADQVDMLAYAVTLGGNTTNNLHKIGHGKPLGLGSVNISITNRYERKYTKGYEYSVEEIVESFDSNPALLDSTAWKDIAKITEYNENSTQKICYPYVIPKEDLTENEKRQFGINDLASHVWFKNNNILLPNIDEADKNKLNVYENIPKNGKKGFSGDYKKDYSKDNGNVKEETGTITKYFVEKEFGFLASKIGSVYFNKRSFSELDREELKEGVQVVFNPEKTEKGFRAARCRIIK